jgi:Subtilase family
MRTVRAAAVSLALLAGAQLGAAPAFALAQAAGAPPTPAARTLARIVVAFANEPRSGVAVAGSTGSRYDGGDGYRLAQSARQTARRVAAAYALHEVASWPIQVLSMHCVVFEITDGRSAAEVLAALSKDRRVTLAQPLQEFHTLSAAGPPAAPPDGATAGAAAATGAAYNDPLYDLQANLTTLAIARAHQRSQGAKVRIALIDTAVDDRHPDLHGRIVSTRSFVSTPASESLRHGTAMAGLIAAVANNHVGIVGIAPLAEIEVFEACWQVAPGNDAATCNTFTLARALAAALASGAPLVNLSLAGPADPLLTALVQVGLTRGVTFVGAAAGDEAPFPTGIAGVITAAGSEQPPPPGALAAPAQHVLTLRPGGEYDFESGASVAAAEVTALIALLMSASPTHLDSARIVALLGSGAPGHPVDVNAALARLDAQSGRARMAASAAP